MLSKSQLVKIPWSEAYKNDKQFGIDRTWLENEEDGDADDEW